MANDDSNTPDAGTASEPLTHDEGVDAIANLLADPEEDNQAKETANDASEDDDDNVVDLFDENEEYDEENAESDVDVDDEENAENEDDGDESQEHYRDGRFAADNANYRMPDGSVMSIAELRDGNLRQANFTTKTQALAEERKTFEAQASQVNQFADALQQQREFFLSLQNELVRPPDPRLREEDPFAYMAAKEDYDNLRNQLGQAWQQHQSLTQHRQQETDTSNAAAKNKRNQEIIDHHPDLRDPKKSAQFDRQFNNQFLPHYGFTQKEVSEVIDHRMLSVIKDAMAYQRIVANRQKAKAKTEGKPKMIKGGNRVSRDSQAAGRKKAKIDRLRKTGSREDAAAVLIDLI